MNKFAALRSVIRAYNIDKNILHTLWYENDDGDKFVPDLTKDYPADNIPKKYKYQVSQFPNMLRTTYLLCDDNGSKEVATGEASWPEDLVLAMANSGDYTLGESILIVGNSCERCMNALAYDYGLDWGYEEESNEWKKSGTVCEFCKGMDDMDKKAQLEMPNYEKKLRELHMELGEKNSTIETLQTELDIAQEELREKEEYIRELEDRLSDYV